MPGRVFPRGASGLAVVPLSELLEALFAWSLFGVVREGDRRDFGELCESLCPSVCEWKNPSVGLAVASARRGRRRNRWSTWPFISRSTFMPLFALLRAVRSVLLARLAPLLRRNAAVRMIRKTPKKPAQGQCQVVIDRPHSKAIGYSDGVDWLRSRCSAYLFMRYVKTLAGCSAPSVLISARACRMTCSGTLDATSR